MSGFDLLSVAPPLLEKIINKVQGKSYFRLQQTCHSVYDFITSSSNNISIPLDGLYYLTDEPDGSLRLKSDGRTIVFNELRAINNVELEAFRGVRLCVFNITESYKTLDFDLVYKFFKKYHITCHTLRIRHIEWTNEQCLALLNIMKPHSVEAYAGIYYTKRVNLLVPLNRTNRYEILLQSDSLKTVDVHLTPENVIQATEQLLAKFKHVSIHIKLEEKPFSLIRKILEMLTTTASRNLAFFYFNINGFWENTTESVLKQEFGDMVWETREIWATGHLDLSQHFPHQTSCELTFALRHYAKIAKIYFMHWEKPPTV